jgi:hypothetical protein
MNPQIMYFLEVTGKSAFFKLQDIFPECFLYRDQSPRVEPLLCLKEDVCHVGKGCMDTLAKRIKVLFDLLPKADLILLYYKKRNVPGMGAGVFWRDFSAPRVITLNLKAWERLKLRGSVYQLQPEDGFFLSGQAPQPILENTAGESKNPSV